MTTYFFVQSVLFFLLVGVVISVPITLVSSTNRSAITVASIAAGGVLEAFAYWCQGRFDLGLLVYAMVAAIVSASGVCLLTSASGFTARCDVAQKTLPRYHHERPNVMRMIAPMLAAPLVLLLVADILIAALPRPYAGSSQETVIWNDACRTIYYLKNWGELYLNPVGLVATITKGTTPATLYILKDENGWKGALAIGRLFTWCAGIATIVSLCLFLLPRRRSESEGRPQEIETGRNGTPEETGGLGDSKEGRERQMGILVICPTCKAKLKAPGRAAGRVAQCPKCGASVTVPDSPPLRVH